MKYLVFGLAFLLCGYCRAQKTDPWLDSLIRSNASPLLKHTLNHPDSFQYQLIYTRIDRDKNNKPSLKNFYLNVDPERYFNPASMVKLPVALIALESINSVNIPGVDKYARIEIDSAHSWQLPVKTDTTSPSGYPSVAHYIRKVFLVSDNDAYNKLYEIPGQGGIMRTLKAKGYPDSRIVRRFMGLTEEQNRYSSPLSFFKDGRPISHKPSEFNRDSIAFAKKILVGRGHWDRNDSLINEPMNFTTHNSMPLVDLQQILQSVIFPETVSAEKRFNLTEDDYEFLYRAMSELPSESRFPHYDSSVYFDSYTKFFWFKDGRAKLPPHVRSFNKTGWSYGFLTDVAYIVDFENKVEFMVSGVIYVNRDGVLNDNKYEYDSVGYPFFKEIGKTIYGYELKRKRLHRPRLDKFKFTYKD